MSSTNLVNRRGFLKTAVTSGVGLGLAACAPNAQAPIVEGSKSNAPAVKQAQEMNVIGWSGDYWKPIWEKCQKDTGIKVNYDVFPAKWDDVMQKFTLWGQSGYDGIDVMAADDLIGAIYSGNGWADDLSGLDAWTKHSDDVAEGVKTLNSASNGVYRIFYFLGLEIFYYNKDIVPTPPKTWEEFVSIGQQVTQPDKDLWAWRPLIGEGHGFNTVALMLHHSGANLETLDDPATLEGLTFIQDWVQKYKITPRSAVEEGWNLVQSIASQGKAAMWWGYDSGFGALLETENTILTKDNLSYARWPMGPKSDHSLIHGWGWMVPKPSKKKDLSKELINWLSEPEQQKAIAIGSKNPPAYKSLFKDPDLLAQLPLLSGGVGWDEIMRGGRFREPIVTSPQCSQLYTMFDNASKYLVAGDKNPQEVWDYMKKELATIKAGN